VVLPNSYIIPRDLDHALAALAQGGAQIIAGGTDVFPSLPPGGFRQNLLDISRIGALTAIAQTETEWLFGAAVTWSDIVRADLPAAFDGLKQAARRVGSLQIQNAGTLGGNLCNASPAADGVPALLALDAQVELVSLARGLRRLSVSDFLRGVRRTALQPDEVMTAVIIPKMSPGAMASFVKLGSRRYLVISIAMVSVVMDCDSAGDIVWARVAVGSCSPVAQRLPLVESAMIGRRAADVVVQASLLAPLSPIEDVLGTVEYRLDAVARLCERAVRKAAGDGN
jgi:CO/xanthine dehydrogenase FAD-binding subunit